MSVSIPDYLFGSWWKTKTHFQPLVLFVFLSKVIAFSFEALSSCLDDWNLFLFTLSCFIMVFLHPLDMLQ